MPVVGHSGQKDPEQPKTEPFPSMTLLRIAVTKAGTSNKLQACAGSVWPLSGTCLASAREDDITGDNLFTGPRLQINQQSVGSHVGFVRVVVVKQIYQRPVSWGRPV